MTKRKILVLISITVVLSVLMVYQPRIAYIGVGVYAGWLLFSVKIKN